MSNRLFLSHPCLCRMFEDLVEAFCSVEPRVSPEDGGSQSGRLFEEDEGTESSLSVGQFVLCHWSDGLYYVGKIQRVSAPALIPVRLLFRLIGCEL